MKLADLGAREFAARLARGGLVLQAGAFKYRLQSGLGQIREGLRLLYAHYPVAPEDDFADFALRLGPGRGLHRWWHRQVRFSSDGETPFEPLPQSHAYPQLEWAMNWCVSTRVDHFLVLHAAVLERKGCALVMPAPPGSGKSTLCAALLHSGWRLLSDELGLLTLDGQQFLPAVRPVSLKNQSLDVIKGFAPQAVFGRVTPDTSKGAVVHMQVPQAHLLRMHEPARPRWVVFPQYEAGAGLTLSSMSKAQSAIELGRNAFNYTRLGLGGFQALCRLVDASDCFRFRYSSLDEAVTAFERLSDDAGAAL